MKPPNDPSWVVFLLTVGKATRHAVCSADEWAEAEAGRPDGRELVRRVAGSEGDAERYARSMQPPPAPPAKKPRPPVSRTKDALPAGLALGL